MDYQHKYLKYKSKYLDIKYDHRFKFIYKIDYDNDLDFKQKYFKYKSKYLDIKYGGTGKSDRAWADFSTAQIRKGSFVFTGNIQNYGPATPDEVAFAEGVQKRKEQDKITHKKK
jgi:hypothetical protein